MDKLRVHLEYNYELLHDLLILNSIVIDPLSGDVLDHKIYFVELPEDLQNGSPSKSLDLLIVDNLNHMFATTYYLLKIERNINLHMGISEEHRSEYRPGKDSTVRVSAH